MNAYMVGLAAVLALWFAIFSLGVVVGGLRQEGRAERLRQRALVAQFREGRAAPCGDAPTRADLAGDATEAAGVSDPHWFV